MQSVQRTVPGNLILQGALDFIHGIHLRAGNIADHRKSRFLQNNVSKRLAHLYVGTFHQTE
jgi:hypothetical protein